MGENSNNDEATLKLDRSPIMDIDLDKRLDYAWDKIIEGDFLPIARERCIDADEGGITAFVFSSTISTEDGTNCDCNVYLIPRDTEKWGRYVKQSQNIGLIMFDPDDVFPVAVHVPSDEMNNSIASVRFFKYYDLSEVTF